MNDNYSYIYGSSNAGRAEGITPNPRRTMTFSKDVFLPNHEWDTRTGRVIQQETPEPVRKRVQSVAIELNQLNDQEARIWNRSQKGFFGIRIRLFHALVALMALFVVLGAFTLSHRAACLDAYDSLEVSLRSQQQLQAKNDELSEDIKEALGDIDYKAVNYLGMVHASDNENAIHLVAVDAYPQQNHQQGYTAEVIPLDWYTHEASYTTASANAAN